MEEEKCEEDRNEYRLSVIVGIMVYAALWCLGVYVLEYSRSIEFGLVSLLLFISLIPFNVFAFKEDKLMTVYGTLVGSILFVSISVVVWGFVQGISSQAHYNFILYTSFMSLMTAMGIMVLPKALRKVIV